MAGTLHDIAPVLNAIPALTRLRGILPTNDYFLVGGTLRDALLGLPVHDIDIVACCDPTPFAQDFADSQQAPWFWLDRERRLSRVLVENGNSFLTFDFAPLRAADLPADLAARDFTINSLALPLGTPPDNDLLIDPLSGLADLHHSCLRMCGGQAFVADPLRILKGVRHAVALGFVLDEQTCQAMVHNAWRLKTISVERVRKEIWAVLSHQAAEHGLHMLSATGVGCLFWGEAFERGLDSMLATLQSCRVAWKRLASRSELIAQWLAEDVEDGFSREGLLLWTLLLADVDPLHPVAYADEWLFSRRARTRIRAIAALDTTLLVELHSLERRPRVLGLWAQKHGLDAADLLLAAVALHETVFVEVDVWIFLVDEVRQGKITDLVDGDWLSQELGIPEGPQIGAALSFVREQEIMGRVVDRQTAQDCLLRHWPKSH